MNCQDISRIIDSGNVSAMRPGEQRDAEAHAHSCRHCAPLWFAHARLAAAPVPAMPPELSVRCLTLAAAEAQAPSPRRVSRVMLVIGGLVVLAAAASMLLVNVANAPAPLREEAVSVPPPLEAPLSAAPPQYIPVPEAATPAAPAKDVAYSLPLLPAPVAATEQRKSQLDLVMRKALELYPEIVEGPEIAGHFLVYLALRADGTVLRNSMLIATTAEEVNAEMQKVRPFSASGQTLIGMNKGMRLADGRNLRGHLSLQFSMVSNDYDLSRSDARVQEIVLASRAHLMLPASSGGFNTLTVLLAEDGTIQRESVEFNNMQEYLQRARQPADPESRAKDMAARLGISVDQIGLMGSTVAQEGTAADPARPPRAMAVNFAWPRRAGEAASVSQRVFSLDGAGAGVDRAAALAIVERMIPEAFVPADQVSRQRASMPAVVFTAEGKVIGVGRVNTQSGEAMALQYQRIAPGVEVGTGSSASVRNGAGQQAEVWFAWEATAAQKEAAEKKRLAAPAK